MYVHVHTVCTCMYVHVHMYIEVWRTHTLTVSSAKAEQGSCSMYTLHVYALENSRGINYRHAYIHNTHTNTLTVYRVWRKSD